jgi:hypothetical protein
MNRLTIVYSQFLELRSRPNPLMASEVTLLVRKSEVHIVFHSQGSPVSCVQVRSTFQYPSAVHNTYFRKTQDCIRSFLKISPTGWLLQRENGWIHPKILDLSLFFEDDVQL